MLVASRDSRLRDKLFPHSPIEVTFEGEEWHIYMEGQWHSRVKLLEEVVLQVKWLIKTYGDDWYYPSTRVNPGWVGWDSISKVDLSGFAVSNTEYRS